LPEKGKGWVCNMSNAYKKAGVDIKLANSIISKIKPLIHSTNIPGVMSEIGNFAGLFSLAQENISDPVLVSGTDGVGTKLVIANLLKKYDTIGIDLVAMCVNDILTCGAKPIFFLDYMAAGRLREEEVVNILKGIVQGCKIAGCALLGGETAEMPGFYKDGDYDLSGFAVGIVDRKKLISGHNIVPGDTIIGLASSGLHSNGYSLVRKIFLSEGESSLNKNVPSLNLSLGEELLKPTRIYVSTILNLLKEFKIKGIAHITGGGFIDNIPRILPANVAITINRDNWPILPIFKLIEEKGNITLSEMFHIFNMGIGLVLVVAKEDEEAVLAGLLQLQEQAYIIGKAKVRTETNRVIYIN
jgi:phosphoribosylformylglycinamidine cyclo-ligase